ncbi:MAG TPA: methyltransferase [Chloroflexi bacterium]|nr:methyltransferase [Chloroflexota bacterium]
MCLRAIEGSQNWHHAKTRAPNQRRESVTHKPGDQENRLLFLLRFLRSPRYLGSITPSSRFLVAKLIGLTDLSVVREAVELGPGTGPFTSGLLAGMREDSRLLCIEREPSLASHLRSRFKDDRLTVVTGDAQDLEQILAAHSFERSVPLIVSGLPFTSLPETDRDAILDAITRSLAPPGDFLLYQYSYAMRSRLRRYFRTVESAWEIRNLPPAVCMRCRL